MRCKIILSGISLLGLLRVLSPAEASAASYEVLPSSTYSSSSSSGPTFAFWAHVIDNTVGKIYSCSVVGLDMAPPRPLTYHCSDLSKTITSTLQPSSNISTSIQPSANQAKLKYGALWQINSNTGELQFCMTMEAANGYILFPNSCLRIDWKSAPPFR
jgi:hypothetical protein